MHDIKMRPVKAASFKMGGGDPEFRPDALPVHTVNLTYDFEIAEEPVSYELFREYHLDTFKAEPDAKAYRGFVIGISWYEAEGFCRWLSKRDGAYCRLPTEAEWEYCARNARNLGVDRMCDLILREWCHDWYGTYDGLEATDPAGRDGGLFKVIRGGFLDNPARFNHFPLDVWTRCSLPPDYRHYPDDVNNEFGRHSIGFRVVSVACGEQTTGEKAPPAYPASLKYAAQTAPPVSFTVKQNKLFHMTELSHERPYFRKRYMLPVPPDNASNKEITALGLNPVMRHHHHSPGFDVAPNGDLVVSIYSTYSEYDAEAGLVGARLRYGADEWEQPDIFLNPVGVNDHAPLLYTDEDKMYHFWGWQQLDDSFPFQYVSSDDSGATWSPVRFPRFAEKAERVVRQPINTVVRGRDGYYYLLCDASVGSASVTWRTKDFVNWENPKGRTAGRHTTAVELKEGRLLAMGGKNSHIDGFMPKAVSSDRGDSWDVSATPFPALTSGQRPCIIRLASGRLFMCGDYQNKEGISPFNDDERKGSYAAYSDDEGETWTLKKLWGTQGRKKNPTLMGGADTLGYSVCRQSPDGLIHIIATNVHPCLHLCFNEAWLLDANPGKSPASAELMRNTASSVAEVKSYAEYYEDGSVKCTYSGGRADDGRFVLHGEEKWFYRDGAVMTVCVYELGRRVGQYAYFNENGDKIWEWKYEGEAAVYITYYENNKVKSIGRYVGRMADGTAQTYARDGKPLTEVAFERGHIVKTTDILRETPAPMGELLEGQL